MRKVLWKSNGDNITSADCTPAQTRGFIDSEDGSMSILALFLFLIIVAAAGIGVDLMKYERERAELQYTMDRAVLAAADLDQKVDAETVVKSYLDKADLLDNLKDVKVINSTGYRHVTASAVAEFPTHFMHLSGVDSLSAPALSSAEESVGAVEVSLVLDFSTSMYGPKLANLKTAAKSIVTQLGLKNGLWNKEVSFSIIPYASQVNVGADMIKYYNLDRFQNYSHCINFVDDEFSKPYLSTTELREQTAHFDPYTMSREPIEYPVCPTRAGSAILPFQNDETVIHNYIDGLTALNPAVWDEDSSEDTGTDNGANWGLALLDPGTRPVINSLAHVDGIVPTMFDNRPVEYGTNVLKILIIISDGDNTDQFMLNSSRRTTTSDIWYNPDATADEGYFSLYQSSGSKEYWWPHDQTWQDHPYGNGGQYCTGKGGSRTCVEQPAADEPGTAVQLTYVELLNLVSLEYIENEIFDTPNAYGVWESAAFSKKESTAKDARTKHVCKAAKDEGVIVFSVGVDVASNGKKVLEDCASSDSHYYDATAVELPDAFTSIGSSVRMLRLTQ